MAALTQTDALYALARDHLQAATRNKSETRLSCLELDAHAKNPGHRGSYSQVGRSARSGCVAGVAGRGLQGVCKGEEERTCLSKIPKR